VFQNYHFEEVDSTNNWIKRNLSLIPEGGLLWVTADAQSGGRGQHGRKWIAEKGSGLWTSFGYWMESNPGKPVSLEVAEQLAAVIASLGIAPVIKLPNDILINGKKLCGILCETVWQGDRQACIVGIGINVKKHPEALDQPTTSLLAEGVDIGISNLLSLIQKHLRCEKTCTHGQSKL
jgi:BirA family biotin operon repressor/biotin-[acetyl-CoA-carboxylase] ligase